MPIVGWPEAAAVWSEQFVDQKYVSFFVRTEFKLGVGQNDPGCLGMFLGGGVEGEAAIANLAKDVGAEELFCLSIGEGKIVALFRFGGGGEDRLRQFGCLEQSWGKRATPGGAFLLVLLPRTSREVAADDAFDGQRSC